MRKVNQIIKYEKKMYLPKGALIPWLVQSKNYVIFRWQRHLRLEEYYSEANNFIGKFCFAYHKRMKNILGQKLGFDVPAHVFGEGLYIHHVGTITVNEHARVGRNCDIAANVCLGGKSGGVSYTWQ